jgi:hypothetical protein
MIPLFRWQRQPLERMGTYLGRNRSAMRAQSVNTQLGIQEMAGDFEVKKDADGAWFWTHQSQSAARSPGASIAARNACTRSGSVKSVATTALILYVVNVDKASQRLSLPRFRISGSLDLQRHNVISRASFFARPPFRYQ